MACLTIADDGHADRATRSCKRAATSQFDSSLEAALVDDEEAAAAARPRSSEPSGQTCKDARDARQAVRGAELPSKMMATTRRRESSTVGTAIAASLSCWRRRSGRRARSRPTMPCASRSPAGGRDLYKIAMPLPLGDKASATTAQTVLSNDLSLSRLLQGARPKAIVPRQPAGRAARDQSAGLAQRRRRGRGQGARDRLRQRREVRVPAVRGRPRATRRCLSKDYRGPMSQARQLVHQWSPTRWSSTTRARTASSPRRSRSRQGDGGKRRDIMVMDWDGDGAQRGHQGVAEHPADVVAVGRRRSRSPRSSTASPTCIVVPAGGGKPRVDVGAARAEHGRAPGRPTAARSRRRCRRTATARSTSCRRRTDHQAADQRSRHRHLADLVARRRAHRLRLRPPRQPADLGDVGRRLGAAQADAARELQPGAVVVPARRIRRRSRSPRATRRWRPTSSPSTPTPEQYTRVTEGHGSSVRPTLGAERARHRLRALERRSGCRRRTGAPSGRSIKRQREAPQWSPSLMKH